MTRGPNQRPHPKGEAHHGAKLTAEQARRIKYGEEPLAVLAALFGVHSRTAYRIRDGERWAHL